MTHQNLYKDEDRKWYLAYWYDRLARHLLGAMPMSFNEWMDTKAMSAFDIYSESIYACVEVKGSSNMDQMKLFADQLDRQIDDLGFPFDSGFVWIFSYVNCRCFQGKQTRLLKKKGKTIEHISDFLASNTNVAYAVDIRLLHAFRCKKKGTKEYTRDKLNTRQIVAINRTQLREVARNLRPSLIDLGFEGEMTRWLPPRAQGIPSRSITTEMDGRTISFEIVLLLPNAPKQRLLKQIGA